MIRGLGAAALAVAFFVLSGCRTAPADIALPTLRSDADPPGEAAALRGVLVRSGPCLALEGGGGGGTTIIVWPRSARARAGGPTVIVVWPFRRTDPPIRTGEEVEMAGIIVGTVDNIAGYARIPNDPGCRSGRYLVLREIRPKR